MHTEKQARQTWCPMARDIRHDGGNRMAYDSSYGAPDITDRAEEYGAEMADLYPCIASKCAWWRGMWRKKVTDRSYWDREDLASKPTAPGKDWERVGHCGMAGEP